jgi:ribosomal-protein-alanine N-acetyltransferase
MDDIVFDSLREEHLAAVMEIERKLFPTPWTEEMFMQEIADDTLSQSHVALRDGDVVGYMIVWHIHDEAHLLNIGVTPAYQRAGVASAMVEFAIEEGRRQQCRMVTLEVREGNEAALRLYKKLGFAPVILRKNYYSEEHEDAIVMMLLLGSSPENESNAG